MGNYGNQWNFYGPKWSMPLILRDFDYLLVGLVVTQAVGTICGMKIIQIFPMISQCCPIIRVMSRKQHVIHPYS